MTEEEAAGEAPPGLWKPLSRHPGLIALILYIVLGVIFFNTGLLPGHTVSAADYLWSSPPWDTMIPKGVPVVSAHPHIVGSNPQLVDGVTVFEPFLQYTRSVLPHIPLWDPYIMGGMPYLADMQSAVFSPFSLPAYILPFWWSLSFIALMKVVVAAMGGYFLARALKMRFGGAFLCGTVYGFGLFMIAWIPWPLTNVFPLIPWLLLATEWVIRKPGVLTGAGLAGLMALQLFGGHPESSMQADFILVLYFLLRVMQAPGGGVAAIRAASRNGSSRPAAFVAAVWRPVVTFGVACAMGTAVAAVTVLPFLQLLGHSSDLSARPRDQVHVLPKYLFAGFLPNYFPGSFEIETAFYVGALPLVLAVVALLRPRVERVAFALAAVGSIFLVVGVQPFFYVAARTPGLDFTYLSRFTILYLLCMALLAGFGLDDIVERYKERSYGRAYVASTVAVALGLLALPVVVVAVSKGTSLSFLGHALDYAFEPFTGAKAPSGIHGDAITRLASLIVWVVVAGAALVLVVLCLSRRIPRHVFAALAVVLVVGDLFQAGMGYNPSIPESHAAQPVTGAIGYLERAEPARYVGVTPYDDVNPIPPNVNLRYGLYDLQGYDLPVISRFGDLWTAYVAPPNIFLPLNTPSVPLSIYNKLSPDTLKVLSLYGVTDVLEQKNAYPLTEPGFRLVYDGPDAKIYENRRALPRTWLVSAEKVVPGAKAQLSAIVADGFDPRTTVITASPLANLSGSASKTDPGSAHITSYGAEKVTIEATATRASELVLSDTYFPGWKVTVNGKTAPLSEVDYLLRGVPVPAGHDRIVFTYDPSSFRDGWVISLASTLIILGGVAVVLLRRRRRPAHRRRGAGAVS